jgi:hypothetical protein
MLCGSTGPPSIAPLIVTPFSISSVIVPPPMTPQKSRNPLKSFSDEAVTFKLFLLEKCVVEIEVFTLNEATFVSESLNQKTYLDRMLVSSSRNAEPVKAIVISERAIWRVRISYASETGFELRESQALVGRD